MRFTRLGLRMIATLLSLLTLSVISSDASYQFSFCVLEFQASVTSSYYRGLNNFPILFSGFPYYNYSTMGPKTLF